MIAEILKQYGDATFDEKVKIYNDISQQLYDFLGVNHPVLNVQLVPVDDVKGNDYNPNKVAPPEMNLLALSIRKDGLTMPCVVANDESGYVIVDRQNYTPPKGEAGQAGQRLAPCIAVVPRWQDVIAVHRQGSHSGQKQDSNQVQVHVLVFLCSC